MLRRTVCKLGVPLADAPGNCVNLRTSAPAKRVPAIASVAGNWTAQNLLKSLWYQRFANPGYKPPPANLGRDVVPGCPEDLLSDERKYWLKHFYPIDNYGWERVCSEKAWGLHGINAYFEAFFGVAIILFIFFQMAFRGCGDAKVFPEWVYCIFYPSFRYWEQETYIREAKTAE
eukprot:NODE_5335_length_714_cov_11.980451_g4488_i0.p2 GENE.NODE_5335_length_714_cov_11.980451_g4488_i0~~NODE_5335_length_714_cov_11.980451_g4488_i0.p2  ORF type:complete len:174 (+),score=45.09 NODE_5335_length_714_cov_11.980451_g4488_i0:87-608(+)